MTSAHSQPHTHKSFQPVIIVCCGILSVQSHHKQLQHIVKCLIIYLNINARISKVTLQKTCRNLFFLPGEGNSTQCVSSLQRHPKLSMDACEVLNLVLVFSGFSKLTRSNVLLLLFTEMHDDFILLIP